MIFIVVILFAFVLGIILKNTGWPLIVFSFVILLPMTALLPDDEALLGFIDPQHFVAVLLISTFYIQGNYHSTKIRKLNIQRKRALILMLIFTLTLSYVRQIKLFLISSINIDSLPKTIIRDMLLAWAIVLIIRRMNDRRIYKAVTKAIIIGGIIIGISIYFYYQITSISNLGTGMVVEERKSGFLSLNPNGAGAYCAIIIGFCLAYIEKERKKRIFYYICIALSLLGIIGTASRTAFITSIALFGIYLIRSKMSFKKIVLPVLILIPTSIFIYSKTGDLMSERIDESLQGKGASSLLHRYQIWGIYFEDIKNKPHYLFFGNTDRQPTIYGHHNYFLYLIWSFGVFIVCLFLLLVYKILKYNNDYSNYGSFAIVYSIFAFLSTSYAGADHPNYILVLIIALSIGIIPRKGLAK